MNSNKAQEDFKTLYNKWERIVQDPQIQYSSRPQDYTDNEPYREIVKLGKDALPYILEKIEEGVFFMNEAALKVAKITSEEIIEEEMKKPVSSRAEFAAEKIPEFLSEQQKSVLILNYLKAK